MKYVLNAILLLILTTKAQAGDIWTAGDQKVKGIIAASVPNAVFIELTQMTINPCGASPVDYYVLPLASPAAKEIHSLLLAAANAKSAVQIALDDTNCHGTPTRPIILRARVFY